MTELLRQVEPRLYFGYGSNLWKEQMMLRCPHCTYRGVGRLTNYRWIINDRGYANIISSRDPEDEVYGLIYDLAPSDEDRLDLNEGVPFSYTKEIVTIDFWESKGGEAVDVRRHGLKKNVLVYVDRKRMVADHPQKEYIHRMNMGINDAVYVAGVPIAYVQKVIRPFIPEHGQTEVEELARKQAINFEEGR